MSRRAKSKRSRFGNGRVRITPCDAPLTPRRRLDAWDLGWGVSIVVHLVLLLILQLPWLLRGREPSGFVINTVWSTDDLGAETQNTTILHSPERLDGNDVIESNDAALLQPRPVVGTGPLAELTVRSLALIGSNLDGLAAPRENARAVSGFSERAAREIHLSSSSIVRAAWRAVVSSGPSRNWNERCWTCVPVKSSRSSSITTSPFRSQDRPERGASLPRAHTTVTGRSAGYARKAPRGEQNRPTRFTRPWGWSRMSFSF